MKLDFAYQIFVLASKALRANVFRSFLTTLGIMIGAMTIVLVVALGEGAKRDIEAQYSNMSVTTILVNAPSTGGEASKLSVDDLPFVLNIPTVTDAVPMLTGKVGVSARENTGSYSVVGTYPNFASVANLEYERGEFFLQSDEDNHVRVAIIGANVAEELYGTSDPEVIGEVIVIGKKEFEIVGVLTYRGGSFGPVSIDESIFTPYSSAYRYALGKNGKFSFNVDATGVDVLESTMNELTRVLRESHNLSAGLPDDFRLRDMGATVASATSSSQTMAILLGAVGLIVLLVGGIGIMNIMYVTVSERTREIGIRKAIGARDKYILVQFLFEAFILTAVGYLAGVILGMSLYQILRSFGFKIVFVWWSLPLSFLITFAVGIFFGYYPAKKASQLDPIEALRYE